MSKLQEFETRLAALTPVTLKENEYSFRCDYSTYQNFLTLLQEFGMGFSVRRSSCTSITPSTVDETGQYYVNVIFSYFYGNESR